MTKESKAPNMKLTQSNRLLERMQPRSAQAKRLKMPLLRERCGFYGEKWIRLCFVTGILQNIYTNVNVDVTLLCKKVSQEAYKNVLTPLGKCIHENQTYFCALAGSTLVDMWFNCTKFNFLSHGHFSTRLITISFIFIQVHAAISGLVSCACSRLPYSWPKFVHLKRLDCDGPVSSDSWFSFFRCTPTHARPPDHYHYIYTRLDHFRYSYQFFC